MKSVCIVIYHLGVGGAEKIVVDEIQEFLRRGMRVNLITLNPERPQSLMADVPEACTRDMIHFDSIFDWRSLRQLAHHFKMMQPDLIISQLWFANAVVRIAASMAGLSKRVVVFEQNVYDNLKTWKQFLLDRLLQRRCVNIVAVSSSVKDSLVRHGIRANRIVVVFNAIDVERFANATPVSIRDELGINDAFLYLSVGRLVEQKAFDVLLDAFAKQRAGILAIAGQGEDRSKLEAQVAELGIQDRVFFLGVRHDIPNLMKAADCFVLASRWEGFGIVFAEAMAAGLPVVASNVDGIREVIVNGETGLLVPPEKRDELSDALMRIQENKELRQHLSLKGLKRARDYFSIEKHVSAILALVA